MGLWIHNITSKRAAAQGSKVSRYAVKINRRTLVEFDHLKGGGAAAVFRAAADALDAADMDMKHDPKEPS
jgi:hypothetical protein